MRRKYLGLAIAAIATFGPIQAFGGDREIAQQIVKRLQQNRSSGALKDFSFDMKVDKGVVLFRGKVSREAQKQLVLRTAEGIQGIENVVDELAIMPVAQAPLAKTVKPSAKVVKSAPASVKTEPPVAKVAKADSPKVKAAPSADASRFSLSKALALQASKIDSNERLPSKIEGVKLDPIVPEKKVTDSVAKKTRIVKADAPRLPAPSVVPGEIMPTAAVELEAERLPNKDDAIVNAVITQLGQAQQEGALKGFGVDVKSRGGIVQLQGRASSHQQREMILDIARKTSGVRGLRDGIQIVAQPRSPSVPQPPRLESVMEAPLSDNRANSARAVAVSTRQPAPMPAAPIEAQPIQAAPIQAAPPQAIPPQAAPQMQTAMAPYRMNAGNMQAIPAGYGGMMGGGMGGAPVMGQPVPMAPYSGGAAAPRYDSPNLPNYAWPGYAAHPNYAALTYPQQYSPSAWPYIGPFYPYPQVPMGWRKVSLEWDDGWWFLDFTDR